LHPGDAGFTLIEAIMVVVLLAILAAAVLIKNPIEKIRLNGAAEKVKTDIRYARKLAVSSQQRAGIEFRTDGYSVYGVMNSITNTAATASSDACSKDASGNFVVDFTAARCAELSGITLSPSMKVAFDSLGIPVDASTGAPLSTQTVTVNGSAGSKTITIEGQTGTVTD